MSVADAKTVMQLLAGKTLDNDQMLRIATNYVYSFGDPVNPHNPDTNPGDYAAFPTPDELAQLFLKMMRREARDRIKAYAQDVAEANYTATIQAARAQIATAVSDAVGEL